MSTLVDELARALHSREDAVFAERAFRAYARRPEVVERATAAWQARSDVLILRRHSPAQCAVYDGSHNSIHDVAAFTGSAAECDSWIDQQCMRVALASLFPDA